jgi:UDP-GlcNAc:undecaprenyl-phosphate GlcNAc-1-phosphate transferase
MSSFYIGSFLIAFAAVLAAVPLVRRWAIGVHFLDHPAGVKSHKAPTPLGGGIAVLIGSVVFVTILTIAAGISIPETAIGIIAGALLMFLIGLYDDYFEMAAPGKMLGQIVSALIFLTFVETYPPILSFPAFLILTVIWIIGLQNAVNFIDNLDGMCGGISLTIAAAFGVLFIVKEMPVFAIISFALAGGALGFLRYNLSPARIFLGDGGSLLFGFMLACLGIVHLNTSKSFTEALAPILIMAFPIFDMTLVTITRLNKGRKVYIASHDHAWDMIRNVGVTREKTVFAILMINLALVASGISVYFMEMTPYRTLIVVGLALILAFIGSQLYKNFLFLKESVLSVLGDLVSINLVFWIYYLIKYRTGLLEYSAVVSPDALAIPLAWINIFWILLYGAFGLYDISHEIRFRSYGATLAKAIILGGAVFLLVNFRPGAGLQISLKSMITFLVMLFVLNLVVRFAIYRYYSARLMASRNRLSAAVINPAGESLDPDCLDPYAPLYNLVGYVGPESRTELPRLGNLADLRGILEKTKTARVILCLDDGDYGNLSAIFGSAFYMETIFMTARSGADNLRGLKKNDTVHENLTVVSIKHRRLFTQLVIRLVDLVIAGAVVILSSPFWVTALLVKKMKNQSYGRTIKIITRGEKEVNMRFTAGTPESGRFRCPASFFSVLKGDISLYGPTITTAGEYRAHGDSLPGFWRKFLLKPGLFGPGYSAAAPDKRFEQDLAYMENTSLSGDLKMILHQILGGSDMTEKRLENA